MFVFRGKAPTRVESPSAELVDSGTSASDLLLQAAGAHSPPSTPHCSVSSPGPLSQTHDQMPDLHELKGDNDWPKVYYFVLWYLIYFHSIDLWIKKQNKYIDSVKRFVGCLLLKVALLFYHTRCNIFYFSYLLIYCYSFIFCIASRLLISSIIIMYTSIRWMICLIASLSTRSLY